MTGWLLELKENLSEAELEKIVIHVVGTKSDVVATEPALRRVPFERTIAYVAEQLHPSRAGTPPPTALGGGFLAEGVGNGAGTYQSTSTFHSADSKRSSGFWGQDIGWDCCHEISAKDGEGIEEVFRVITRKLVEQRSRREELVLRQRVRARNGDGGIPESLAGLEDGNGSFRLGAGDKRRSWLGLTGSSIVLDGEEELIEMERRGRGGKCC